MDYLPTMLYILIGPAGCGKSTLAKKLNKYDAYIVSSDEIRGYLFGHEECQENPKLVFDVAHTRIRNHLAMGHSVVFDATNLHTAHRKTVIDIGQEYGATIIGVVYDGSVDLCLARNEKRKRNVPTSVIERMYSMQQQFPPTLNEGFDALYAMSYADDTLLEWLRGDAE